MVIVSRLSTLNTRAWTVGAHAMRHEDSCMRTRVSLTPSPVKLFTVVVKSILRRPFVGLLSLTASRADASRSSLSSQLLRAFKRISEADWGASILRGFAGQAAGHLILIDRMQKL